jgi:eukaryotic-like serine/threonine-protein kinase
LISKAYSNILFVMSLNFGPYQIGEKIAEGAYAEIFKVATGGREFALKKLKLHLKYDSEAIAVLRTEGELLRLVQGERHFPKLIDSGIVEEENFLVLEWIQGANLREISKNSSESRLEITLTDKAQLVWEICGGVEFLHGLKASPGTAVIHGDLKPENVMVDITGRVVILDLGLKGGTFTYVPLERLHEKVIGPYSDIYATGHIFFELLHGVKLFQAKTELEAYFQMRDLRISEEIFSSEIPLSIRRILVRALNQDPRSRFEKISEFREALEDYFQEEGLNPKQRPLGVWTKGLNSLK